MTDREGKPVTDPKKAHIIEVVGADGTHTILAREDSTEDPFGEGRS